MFEYYGGGGGGGGGDRGVGSIFMRGGIGGWGQFFIIDVLYICPFPASFPLQMTISNSFSHSNV